MTRLTWLGIVALSILWGAAYLVIDLALRGFPPVLVVLVRVMLAGLFLLPFALKRDVLPALKKEPRWVLLTVLLQATAPMLLLTIGQHWLSPGLAGILVGSQPLFVALLALKFNPSERPRGALGLIGLLLGFAGLVLLFGVDINAGARPLLGGALLVASAICYACGAHLIHNKLDFADPLGIAFVAMLVSTVALLIPGLLAIPDAKPTAISSIALIALGIVFTGVTLTLNYSLIKNAGPARATLAFYLSPGVTVLLSWLLLGERVSWSTGAGLVAIVAGSILTAKRVRTSVNSTER